MFYARIVSGLLALLAFVFGLSAVTVHHAAYDDVNPSPLNSSAPPASSQTLYYTYHNDDATPLPVALHGVRVVASDRTELVLQRPAGNLLGTVIFFHGCSHSATDFFPAGDLCPQCIGLPEETRMVRIALERGYGVVAVSSTNRERKCWGTHPEAKEGPDYDRVSTALREAQARNAYSPRVPLFAIGISSGGLFATSLPLRFQVAGVNSMISSAVCLFWTGTDNQITDAYPAHVFTHMGEQDKGTARRVHAAMRTLTRFGTHAAEYSVSPKPVTVQYLTEAVPRWGTDLARRVVAALKAGGYLDESYRLLSDPRHSYWRKSVQHLKHELEDSLVADESALSEELNRAWAAHEITAEHFSSTLDFLEDRLRG